MFAIPQKTLEWFQFSSAVYSSQTVPNLSFHQAKAKDLHVFPMYLWIPVGYFIFLPQSRQIHVR